MPRRAVRGELFTSADLVSLTNGGGGVVTVSGVAQNAFWGGTVPWTSSATDPTLDVGVDGTLLSLGA